MLAVGHKARNQELVQDKFMVVVADIYHQEPIQNPLNNKNKSHNKQISGRGQLLHNKERKMKKQEQGVKVKLEPQPREQQQEKKSILAM